MATKKPSFKGVIARVDSLRMPGRGKWAQVAAAIKAAWIAEVNALPVPARWKRAYARCIKAEATNRKATVTLDTSDAKGPDHMFAMAIEYGVNKGGIDMKTWLLQGKPYVNVPIMHTQGKIGTYAPMAGLTKKKVQELLSSLGAGERAPAGLVDRLHYSRAPRHSITDPLAHALRQTEAFVSAKGRSSGTEGTITTFRRISKGSRPGSWHWAREGRKAYRLAKVMRGKIGDIARKVIMS